jgi:predicted DNA-binding transcriptional regulator AlpA
VLSRTPARAAAQPSPLLSIRELAVLAGLNPSTLYRSIARGEFPLPIVRLGNRIRVSWAAAEALLFGEPGAAPSQAGPQPEMPQDHCPNCAGALRRRPMCAAARRSSSGTASV